VVADELADRRGAQLRRRVAASTATPATKMYFMFVLALVVVFLVLVAQFESSCTRCDHDHGARSR